MRAGSSREGSPASGRIRIAHWGVNCAFDLQATGIVGGGRSVEAERRGLGATRWHSGRVGRGGDTYYDILGLSTGATPDDVKASYRRLILRVHPDVKGPAALFRQVQEAYEVLSDPARRASYDRSLRLQGWAVRSPLDARDRWSPPANPTAGPRDAGAARSVGRPKTRGLGGRRFSSLLSRYPAATVGMTGAILLVFGAALTEFGAALILLGAVSLMTAALAGLGGRGAKECEAYQRSGITAVDTMTERQFEALLEHFFAKKGCRVARIGGRGDLLVYDAHERIVVQARRWNRLVRHDAVQLAVAAMDRYGAARALVVTSSNYSQDAVTAANLNGVTLWNRADLAAVLTLFNGTQFQSGWERLSSEIRAGSRIGLGFLSAIFVAVMTVGPKARRAPTSRRRPG